jgi:hypothetical protein
MGMAIRCCLSCHVKPGMKPALQRPPVFALHLFIESVQSRLAFSCLVVPGVSPGMKLEVDGAHDAVLQGAG